MSLAKALLCQVLAVIAIGLLRTFLPPEGIDSRFYLLLQAIIAAAFSSLLGQAIWWRVIHLLFMPAVGLMLAFNLPSWLYLLILILLTLVFWGTVKGDVPLFLSSAEVNDEVIAILKREKASHFIELGVGIGTVVAPVARRLPNLRIDAVERAPMPCLVAYWRCRNLPNVRIVFGSFWQRSLADYEVVFGFLSPLVMAEIAQKARREMREGSLFISSSFPVPDWPAETVVQIGDRRQTRLYCYRIPSGKASRQPSAKRKRKLGSRNS